MTKGAVKKPLDLRVPAILLFIVFILFSATNLYWHYMHSRFTKEAIAATGYVEKTYRAGKTPSIAYVYTDTSGVKHRAEEPYNVEQWHTLTQGSQIPIIYLRDKPDYSITALRLDNLKQNSGGIPVITFIPLAGAIFCLVVHWFMRRRKA